MIRYIINRLLSIVFTFFFISVLVFVLMHAIPGGPFDPVDMPLSDSAKAKILKQYGLDQPLYVQYFKYMWGVLQFDFGIPYQSPGETVLELIGRAWIPSLILGGSGVLIGAPIGIAAYAVIGSIHFLGSPQPEAGSHSNQTENNKINNILITNTGTVSPSVEMADVK